MSRLGKTPVVVPQGVDVTFADGVMTVVGPKGTLTREMKSDISVEIGAEGVTFTPVRETPHSLALWGTYPAHLSNMIHGVTEGFTKKLGIEGVGYRAEVQGQKVVLNVGFSHPVELAIPEGLAVEVEKSAITVSGIDKDAVGQFAANIRKVRPPEPYKGKGIHYEGEYIIRKQGKRAVA